MSRSKCPASIRIRFEFSIQNPSICISKGFEINVQVLSQFLIRWIQLSRNEVFAVRAQTFIVNLNGKFVWWCLKRKLFGSRLFGFTIEILTNVLEMKKNDIVKYPIFILTEVPFVTGVQKSRFENTDVTFHLLIFINCLWNQHDFSGYYGWSRIS